ncbi:MAG: hypothetical protein HQL22_10065 [Candidatus Omnitrophica bacterium]|nr:hypothetical protein [Candidatus Omnitrophota bacterium]
MLFKSHTFELLALVASVVMPMWNIPLIVQIFRRKSSADLSLYWAWGVWTCMLLMVPWAFITSDQVLRVFSIINFVLFSGVVIAVMKYRKVPDARS